MFDYNDWKKAAPVPLKTNLKSEMAALKKHCPPAGRLTTYKDIDVANAAASEFLAKVKDVEKKIKDPNSDAGALVAHYKATIKTYLKAVIKQKQDMIAEGNKIFKEIRLKLKSCEALYIEARAAAKLAMEDSAIHQDEKKHLNYILKQLKPRMKKIDSLGSEAAMMWKRRGDLLSEAQDGLCQSWFGGKGIYSQIAGPVSEVLKKATSGSVLIVRDADHKKTFSYKPGSIKDA